MSLLNPQTDIEKQILTFKWPDQMFYFLNEEVANLNRDLVNLYTMPSKQGTESAESVFKKKPFDKLLKIIKICVILSK